MTGREKMEITRRGCVGGLLALMAGCGPFWVDPYITVKPSALNWVQIHYYNMGSKPTKRISVYITGSGYVEVKKGTSELVSNDFAKVYDAATWENIKSYRLNVDAKYVNDIFQNLVNYGLLDREKTGRRSKKTTFTRFIAVKANMSGTTYSEQDNIFEVDPDLAEQLLDVIRQFDNPMVR